MTDRVEKFSEWLTSVRNQLDDLSVELKENSLAVRRTGGTLDPSWVLERIVYEQERGLRLQNELHILRSLVSRIFLGMSDESQEVILNDVTLSITAACDAKRELAKKVPKPKPSIVVPIPQPLKLC